MLQEQESGELAFVQMSVQLPVVERYCSVTAVKPEPPSEALPETETVPVSGEPGSLVVAAGAVLSTRRSVIVSLRE